MGGGITLALLAIGIGLIAFGLVSHLQRSILLRLLWLLWEYPGASAAGLLWRYEKRYGIEQRRLDLVRWRLARLDEAGALRATGYGRAVAGAARALGSRVGLVRRRTLVLLAKAAWAVWMVAILLCYLRILGQR